MRTSITCTLAILYAACLTAAAEPFHHKALIFEPQGEHCHGSTLVELPNGDVLSAWFQGSGERSADDVRILGARKAAGADAWSEVFPMADTPKVPDCNPVLFLDAQERVWLFWIAVVANAWESSLLRYRRAETWDGDDAPAWSWQGVILLQPGAEFPKQLEAGFEELDYDQEMWAEYAPPYDELLVDAAGDKFKRRMGWMTRTHAHTLASGRMLLPLYSDGFNVSMTAYSDDDGVTWHASAPIVGLGPIQPAVVAKQDGTLVAYMRDSGPMPKRIMRAESKDDGATWTVARDTELLGSSASVQVRALRDGRWVLVHNDTVFGRNRLALSMSDDEGASWKWKRYIDKAEGGRGSFAYPSIIEARDGRIHLTYSHKTDAGASIAYAVINAEWIAAAD